jgi:hypothetical protein
MYGVRRQAKRDAALVSQVEHKDDLNDLWWTRVGGVLFGNGGTLTFTNPVSSQRQFFRFRILP